MFERFTDEARQVVTVAQDEARMMRHGRVGTEHLLVALAEVPPLGMNRSSARAEVVKAVGLGDEPDTGQMMPFTAAAQEALDTSVHESMKLGHDTVEPGHVLLGLLRQRDGVALRVLAASGRSLRDLREAVIAGLTLARDTADGPVTVRVGTSSWATSATSARTPGCCSRCSNAAGRWPPGCASAGSTRPPCGGCSSRAAGGAWRPAPRRRAPANGRRRRRAPAACRPDRATAPRAGPDPSRAAPGRCRAGPRRS